MPSRWAAGAAGVAVCSHKDPWGPPECPEPGVGTTGDPCAVAGHTLPRPRPPLLPHDPFKSGPSERRAGSGSFRGCERRWAGPWGCGRTLKWRQGAAPWGLLCVPPPGPQESQRRRAQGILDVGGSLLTSPPLPMPAMKRVPQQQLHSLGTARRGQWATRLSSVPAGKSVSANGPRGSSRQTCPALLSRGQETKNLHPNQFDSQPALGGGEFG